jgi:RNA polymerase subunit RPABC4/transcription elongation factor Spt4
MESERNTMVEPAPEREKICKRCALRVAHSLRECPNCKCEEFTAVRDDMYIASQDESLP